MKQELLSIAEAEFDAVCDLIRALAPIPAPSHHEEKRAEFVRNWMLTNGAADVRIDEALNVIWSLKTDNTDETYLFMAHTDVVFPDTSPLPFHEDADRFHCPGVGDDTACLAVLLHSVKCLLDHGYVPKKNILICANSCEEGLGNLKGCKAVVDAHRSVLGGVYTVDGILGHATTSAVGSHRYRVTVRTEGGHSFHAFGNRNAIAELSGVICDLYQMHVPKKRGSKTTYNVGMIEGGTSVNTIAQNAGMLFEYRSDDIECLSAMKAAFERIIQKHRERGIQIEVELIGDRPAGRCGDEERYAKFLAPVIRANREVIGSELTQGSGSTDANYPLSLGIPAACIGGARFINSHRRDESLEIASLKDGLQFVTAVLGEFFEKKV